MTNLKPPIFRKRNTHFPKTYFLFLKDKTLYLLFWLEYGRDNSLYVWLDDDPNLGWEVMAKHTQGNIDGMQSIDFKENVLNVFDPHISWHKSGRIHVGGYNKQGKSGERLINDKKSTSLKDLESGTTVPVTQIVLPVIDPKRTLKSFGKGPKEMYGETTWVGLLSKDGFKVANNNTPAEAFFIINDDILPEDSHIAIDIGVHNKNFPATFIGLNEARQHMLFSKIISLHKEKTQIAAAIRVFEVKALNKDARETKNAVATCFNKESVDLFLFHRKNTHKIVNNYFYGKNNKK